MMLRAMICSFVLIWCQGYGQTELDQKLKNILSNTTFDYAAVGLSVRSMDGQEVVNLDGDRKYIPASSLKLITTFLALEEFGEDYKFNTRIGYSGQIDRSGTLNGNIVVIGAGDPTFGSARYGDGNSWDKSLEKIIEAVKKVGIICIEGKIEVKTNVFQGQAICPSWPYADVANYYGSGAWGLNFNENKYNLFFSGKVPEGAIATIDRISPVIPNMYLQSEVVVKGPKTGDNAYIYGDAFNYAKIIRGSIPFTKSPFVIKGAIPNPPLSLAFVIEDELSKKGIKSNGSITTKDPIKKSEFNQLVKFTSPKLSRIVEEANFESINLYCEALLRLLGRKMKKEGSIEAGLEYVKETLEDAEIPENSFNINDGSGLSPRNTLAPSSFTQFLCAVNKEMTVQKMQSYIPQVGVSGTVKSIMAGKKGQKKFFLKSGSMGGVLTYTGVFQAQSGKQFAISFMSNNHSKGNYAVKVQAEKIFEALYLGL